MKRQVDSVPIPKGTIVTEEIPKLLDPTAAESIGAAAEAISKGGKATVLVTAFAQ